MSLKRIDVAESPPRPVFVLGLGVQKAGTTTLYSALAATEGFRPSIAKELHVWDRKELGPRRKLLSVRSRKDLILWAMEKVPSLYFWHFKRRLSEREGQTGTSFSADFTPRHQLLQSKTLDKIARGFEKRGIEVKALLILRYPAHRVVSAALMAFRRSKATEVDAFVLSTASKERVRQQTDYIRTIQQISESKLSNVFVSAFETLFIRQDQDEWNRLSSFLGLRLSPPGYAPQEGTPSVAQVTSETVKTVEEDYKDQVNYIAKNYPAIHASWSDYL